MTRTRNILATGLLLLLALALTAQEPVPATPPPGTPPQATPPATPGPDETAEQATPATDQGLETATGLLPYRRFEGGKSVLIPGFTFLQSFDTNADYTGLQPELEMVSTLGGSLELRLNRRRNRFLFEYGGGGSFYKNNSGLNNSYHRLDLEHMFTNRRWSLHLLSQTSYMNESSFGFAGLSNSDLSPGVEPSQQILTPRSERVSTTVGADIARRLGRKMVLTGSASYGVLRFIDSSLLESNQLGFGGGLEVPLNRRDTLGVQYSGGITETAQDDTTVTTHAALAVYSRHLSRYLRFRGSVGPQAVHLTSLRTTLSKSAVSGQAGLSYSRRQNELSLAYHHGVTGGSGIFTGAYSDSVSGSFSRGITRQWRAFLSGGYAHNRVLDPSQTALAAQRYDTFFGSAEVERKIGRTVSLFFRYNLQYQEANITACTTPGCFRDPYRHIFGVGFAWKAQPIRID